MVHYTYWLWENVLSEDFCNYVLNNLNWNDGQSATITNDELINKDIRRTDVVWQDVAQPLGCVMQTYTHLANQAAEWNFDINSFELVQLGRYKAEDSGYYDWHSDTTEPINNEQRKLSCVILLNDSSEFEGGVLKFKGLEDKNILTKKGSIIVFPSFIEHTVTPVTEGVRYSAVAWASGPSFK